MRLFLVEILAISLSLVFISCDEDNVTGNGVNLVRVNVDLQYGFEGHFVRVKFNENVYFSADLTSAAPFAGPKATFIAFLPRGLNQCEIFWQENYGSAHQPYNIYSKEVNLGNADIYYMGIRVSNDSTFVIDLQEEPFGYAFKHPTWKEEEEWRIFTLNQFFTIEVILV